MDLTLAMMTLYSAKCIKLSFWKNDRWILPMSQRQLSMLLQANISSYNIVYCRNREFEPGSNLSESIRMRIWAKYFNLAAATIDPF